MKTRDDYKAKYRMWAENLHIVSDAPTKIPNFKSKRFTSHGEMNIWKKSVLQQLAQAVPANE